MNATTRRCRSIGLVLGVCLLLVTISWVAFGQTLGHEFINHDDPQYILENPAVTNGLNWSGIKWAFTHKVASNWHPLTMLTHMADCHFSGLNAGVHHRTNLILHTLAAVSLFLLLRIMTGAFWASAFVAALFAIHPLRVESVAWISERKDVLSGLFFVLTLAAYVRYVRRPSGTKYVLVATMLALGLMSKPMLVTLPLVLLLLDYWPLRRATSQSALADNAVWGRLVVEKFPLLLLSIVASGITLMMQQNTVSSMPMIPLWLRAYTALSSCVVYIGQMLWPTKLALFYPYPSGALSVWVLLFAIAVLSIVTYGVWRFRKQRPYLIVGWFWYLIMLAPVIGLVQVGRQAHADRYTYLPQIGLYLAVTWAMHDLSASWRFRRVILSSLAITGIALLTRLTQRQASHWRNSESIWTRTLAVTSNNAVAHKSLGLVLLKKAQVEPAIFHLSESLRIAPDFIGGHINPDNAAIHYNLGNAFLVKRRFDDATSHYQKALQLRPDYADVYENFGNALWQRGKVDQAIEQWQQALSVRPDDPNLHASLGTALARNRLFEEAVAHYEKSLASAEPSVVTLNNFALLLATCSEAEFRDGFRATELAKQADALSAGQNPSVVRTLAAAYAETGRFKEATDTAERALELGLARSDSTLVNDVRLDLDLYQLNLPRRAR